MLLISKSLNLSKKCIALLAYVPRNHRSQRDNESHLSPSCFLKQRCCLFPFFLLYYPQGQRSSVAEHVQEFLYLIGCRQTEGTMSPKEACWMYWRVLQASRMQTQLGEAKKKEQYMYIAWGDQQYYYSSWIGCQDAGYPTFRKNLGTKSVHGQLFTYFTPNSRTFNW